MIENGSWRVRFVRSLAQFSILILVVLGMVSTNSARAGDGGRDRDSDDRDRGGLDGREHEHGGGDKQLATDWSHRHLVYSGPRDLAHAFSLSRETRYKHQWVRRNAEHHGETRWRHQEDPLNKDWSEFLGNAGTVGAGHYPAKYSFDATTATCGTAAKPDFVVFNTSLTPSASAKSASVNGTFAAAATPGDNMTITNPLTGLSITLTATTGVSTGLFWHNTGTTTGDASSLAASIALNGPTVGVTGSAAGAVVTVTARDVGDADNVISVSNSNAASFTWAAATLGGGTNGASIAAFDNLYSGCTGTVPSVFWAYNTGGIAATSVSLSGDGTQIAFVQNNSDGLNGSTIGVAELVILKWKASATDTVNVPAPTITFFAPAGYRACAAPCMTRIPFSTLQGDANSAPFYDFAPGSDKIYVGDNNGSLLQFTGVFNGTPAQFTTAPWPVVLTAGRITTSPVFYEAATAANSRIFIADNSGHLYAVTTAGAVTASGALGFTTLGIQDGPIVDSSVGNVYVFVSNNGTAACGVAGAGLPAVYQLPVTFAPAGVGTNVTFGTCSDSVIQYDGQFDNAYYISASGNAGNLYVCGNPGGNATLYQIPLLASGLMGALVTGPNLSTANTTCSPVTEVNNPGAAKDWIFMSVQSSSNTAAPISCPAPSGGCVVSFDVTSGAAITAATATAAKAAAAGGTSGIVADNTVGAGTLAGASQVYFSTLVNGSAVCTTSGGTFLGGCGTQASQLGLN